MFKMFNILLLIGTFVVSISGFKILLVFPFPGGSHSILGHGFVRHLLNAGHEITYVGAIPYKKVHQNLTQINVESNFQLVRPEIFNLTEMLDRPSTSLDISLINQFMHVLANETACHPNVQELLLDTNQRFDAVIVEWMYTEIYSGFSAVFDCPLIWSSSMDPHSMILSLIDEDGNPAYTPEHMSMHNTPLNFLQRVLELKELLRIKWLQWLQLPAKQASFEQAFGPAVQKRGRVLPPYETVIYNGSIVLGNSHVSSGQSIKLPQNYIPIGGYHIDSEVKPLPQDLQKIMDAAENGVIYFSMGTMLKSETMPNSLKTNLLNMFGALKQTVIWKLDEKWKELPKNVFVVEWAPQPSILAHPNCVLFITHGGLLSLTETLHYGVPVISIPMFADQFINTKRACDKGFALEVQLNMNTPNNLKLAIEEMFGNSKYRQRVKELSFVYHHRSTPPGKALVHAVEHVIRTRGAPHLRSPALILTWYQKLYLDLLSLILIGLTIVVLGLKRLCNLLRVNKTLTGDKKTD